jgi:hypothetical protein
MDNLPRLPFGGVAVRVGACSARCAFGGDASGTLVTRVSVAGRPRLGPRLPSLRQERRPLSAPGAFARIECASLLGRFRDRARLRPPLRIGSALAGRRRSFCVHSTKVLVHLRQSPDSAL